MDTDWSSDMIKQLRIRICVVISAVLILILAGIEVYLYCESWSYQKEAEEIFLEETVDGLLAEEDGAAEQTEQISFLYSELPVFAFKNTGDGLHFIMKAESFGEGQNQGANRAAEAMRRAEEIANLGVSDGKYREFRFLCKEDVLVLYDESEWEEYNEEIIRGMILTFLLASAVIAGISVLLSGWLTKPAKKAFEQQKQFVSDASHELKTPLTIIGANAQRLHKEIGDNRWLDYILKENRRMGKLLEELLVLARVENTPSDSGYQRFNLSRALTGALLPYESEAFEQGVHFYMDIMEECFITGQEEHLKQVVIILVDNALHHVSDGGNVWVRLSEKKDKVFLEVANTGEEIPEEDRKKIFQRFYQADKARAGKQNRHGLGLAIADAVVQRHRGKITVECRDGVTRFCLALRK